MITKDASNNLSGALNGLCKPCLGHWDKLSTNGYNKLRTVKTFLR